MARLATIALLGGLVALGGIGLYMAQQKGEKTQKKSEINQKEESKPARAGSANKTPSSLLTREQVKEILHQLEKAAKTAAENMDDAKSQIEQERGSLDANLLKAMSVQLIVKALAPVQNAHTQIRNQFGVDQDQVRHAIEENIMDDQEINQLSQSLSATRQQISQTSAMLMNIS